MRVLAALSGGVDSSVAAALMVEAGHDVVGVTMKLWGGSQDSGCCSVGDVDDARRVAQQLGIAHHVFNFTDDFDAQVVLPYVAAHAAGRTPNPCIACNRHLKFDRLLVRAGQIGCDAVATGHHARALRRPGGGWTLLRGVDGAKDQSYVLYMLGQRTLGQVCFPVGELTKADVRALAADLGLRTAVKPESQDTCFITAVGGREAFLGERITLHPGRLVDRRGAEVGAVRAVEMVTVGQRRGLGGNGARRYALAVDAATATVTVGTERDLLTDRAEVVEPTWVSGGPPPAGTAVNVQMTAHGCPAPASWDGIGVVFGTPQRRPAPGQAVVLYDGDEVLGGGTAR
ncbi:MAG TPA: tRNA 2-thiouridine(34) synthase MnmA [Acidimicrobiales bacterium]|jgi:tRNA-specific 2-thiouridylase